MSNVIAWMAAEVEQPEIAAGAEFPKRRGVDDSAEKKLTLRGLRAHKFPAKEAETSEGTDERSLARTKHVEDGAAATSPFPAKSAGNGAPVESSRAEEINRGARAEVREEEQERRIYRGRTVAMLRRYMRYSIETGRLPSLLGRESFRAKVTSYTVVTFEDRVIFVHDMEKCLDRLDEFSPTTDRAAHFAGA